MNNDLIDEILNKIKSHIDKIYFFPLEDSEIITIQKILGVIFPDIYTSYLKKIGLKQDLIEPHKYSELQLFESEQDFIDQKDFLQDIIENNAEIYFAFGHNGCGDLFLLKRKEENDNYIYEVLHDTGEIIKIDMSYSDFLRCEVNLTLDSIDDHKKNENKKWSVQFSLKTDSENNIITVLNQEFDANLSEDWEFIDESPAKVREFHKKLMINQKEFILKKLEYENWENPNYFFNMEESLNQINDSMIKKLHNLFSKHQYLGYKLIDYGIL